MLEGRFRIRLPNDGNLFMPQNDLGERRVHCGSQTHHGIRDKVFLRVAEI